jgi:hypothetical protein
MVTIDALDHGVCGLVGQVVLFPGEAIGEAHRLPEGVAVTVALGVRGTKIMSTQAMCAPRCPSMKLCLPIRVPRGRVTAWTVRGRTVAVNRPRRRGRGLIERPHLDVPANPAQTMTMPSFGMSREPSPRLTNTPIITYNNLTPSEVMAMLLVSGVMPLIGFATSLPFPIKIVAVACWASWGPLLFFVRRQDETAATWFSRFVPFWLRQRAFRGVPASSRVTAIDDLIGIATSVGPNAVWFTWKQGTDGVLELHVYEEPTRPLRAWAVETEPHPFERYEFDPAMFDRSAA